MSQTDAPGFVQGCALRIARLAVDGSTPAGPTNAYCTRNLVKLTWKPELEAGQDFTTKDACGGLPITYRQRDILKRYQADLEMVYPDPEVSELLVAAPLITSIIGTTRTVADGVTTSGSAVVTSASAAFTATDVGNVITGTGIPVSPPTTILSITSPTAAVMSAAATATASSISITLTAQARSVGAQAPQLAVLPPDFGVSLEVWQKAVTGNVQATVNPWVRWAFPQSVWAPSDREIGNAVMATKFTGFLYENPNWGNGPFNDWTMPSPSTASLTRAWGWCRESSLPTVQNGYIATPVQV